VVGFWIVHAAQYGGDIIKCEIGFGFVILPGVNKLRW